MRRYSYKKSYAWNEDIAYLVGLLAADGCLINNNRHINLTSKDKELIDITQKILRTDVKVRKKQSMYGSQAYHLQFSNVAFYDFLLRAGLTPAKSKTLGVIKLPDKYYRHFLRGYFDGDGSIHGFWDKRWKNSLMYYCEFTSASPQFLTWLQTKNCQLVQVSPGRIKPGVRAQALSYAKTDSRKLFNFIYPDTNCPRLPRKYKRFVDLLTADPYANTSNGRVLESGRQATLRS